MLINKERTEEERVKGNKKEELQNFSFNLSSKHTTRTNASMSILQLL